MSTAPMSVAARGDMGSTDLNCRWASSTTWDRGTSPTSALRMPSGLRATLTTLRSSTTRTRSASSSVRLSSAGPDGLSSPPLPQGPLLLPLGYRPRLRVLPAFPPGGEWQGVIAHLAGEPGARTGGDRQDRQDGGGESSRPQTGGAPSRAYPAGPQVVHREGPHEGAGYAYRGTIVGEASNPGLADPGAVLRGRRPIAACCRDPTGVEELRDSFTSSRELLLASPMSESRCPCRRAPPAVGGGSLPLACGSELSPPRRGPPPRLARWASPGVDAGAPLFGLHRAGPREGARYGYRGVIVGEASHLGPVPTPADLSGAASPGEVLRYMRPTAGAGIGPSRGGGHRQGKGGRASGLGRRGRSSMGARADPPVPASPPGGDVDLAGGPSARPGGPTPQDLGADPPLVYAPASGAGFPVAEMAEDRADDFSSQATGGETT